MTQLSDYERNSLNKLGQSIIDGKWTNVGMVQLIELPASNETRPIRPGFVRLAGVLKPGVQSRAGVFKTTC